MGGLRKPPNGSDPSSPPPSPDTTLEDPDPIGETLEEQAIGFYSDGSLINPSVFPEEGIGFYLLNPGRGVHYGTEWLISSISAIASSYRVWSPDGEPLQIGDVSKIQGEKLFSHISHQNGLDIDIAYLDRRRVERTRGNGFEFSYVKWGHVTEDFDIERNWWLFKRLINTSKVVRIFVDRRIKRAICKYASQIGEEATSSEVLRRLRPWKHHKDHMHIRFTCPPGSRRCDDQEEPPPGSGC
jgi:penicillin-insensitive murein endopeptidase